MNVTDGLRAYLVAQAAITNLVGTTNPRVFGGNKRPQGTTLPAITYSIVSSDHPHHMTAATARAMARIQINAWAVTYVGALALADAIREELDGYRGTMGSDTVRMCHLESCDDDWLPPGEGTDVGTYVVSQDYSIWYVSTVPTF